MQQMIQGVCQSDSKLMLLLVPICLFSVNDNMTLVDAEKVHVLHASFFCILMKFDHLPDHCVIRSSNHRITAGSGHEPEGSRIAATVGQLEAEDAGATDRQSDGI